MNSELSSLSTEPFFSFESKPFSVKYNRKTLPEDYTFPEAFHDVVRGIRLEAKSLGMMPCVLYSGGLDSEAIILELEHQGLVAGKDFRIMHGVYDTVGNSQDTEWVLKLGRATSFFHLETSWYTSQECFNFCVQNEISFVTMTPVARMLLQCKEEGLYPIVGHGDPQIYWHEGPVLKHWDFEFQQTWPKFVKRHGIVGCVDPYRRNSFIYELMVRSAFKYTGDPLEFTFFNNKVARHKLDLFGHLGVKERPKYTGHENYRTEAISEVNKRLQQINGYDTTTFLCKPLKQFIDDWHYD